jgi:hypothetical protein
MRNEVKCRCLWCKTVFHVSAYRLTDLSSGAHRRGVACSNICRVKLFKSWMLAGMKRDKEYQALLRDREKLRRLVREQKKAA